jgi:hypothetical protein
LKAQLPAGVTPEMMNQAVQGPTCNVVHSDTNRRVVPIINQTYNVAIAFVDFADGLLPAGHPNAGNPPSTPDEVQELVDSPQGNQDACGSLSFRQKAPSELGNLWKYVPNKYEWRHYWNMYFSTNGAWRDSGNYHAHPDYEAYGQTRVGFLARANGSFREYWREVSYGNVNIEPYRFRTNQGLLVPDSLQGFVNEWQVLPNGKRVVKWINMGIAKRAITGRIDGYVLYTVENILRQEYASGRIGFNLDAFYAANPQNKLIVVHAGSGPGGIVSSLDSRVTREKSLANWFYASANVLSALGVSIHEFGHLIGFYPSAEGVGLGYSTKKMGMIK